MRPSCGGKLAKSLSVTSSRPSLSLQTASDRLLSLKDRICQESA